VIDFLYLNKKIIEKVLWHFSSKSVSDIVIMLFCIESNKVKSEDAEILEIKLSFL